MIRITDNIAISSDDNQWMLCKRRKATNKYPESWPPFKFYASLAACSDALRQHLLRTSEYETFADLDRNLREINRLLDKKLKVAI